MSWIKNITVEVPVLLLFFEFTLIGSLTSNLVIFRTCYVILGYNESDCALLGNTDNNVTENLEKITQPYAQTINVVSSTIQSIFTIIFCVFLGPWTDKFGRKPILLLCQMGYIMNMLLMSLFSAIPSISPWFFMISSIPSVLTGGTPTFMTVCLAYLTDKSTQDTRGMRMAILEGFMALGSIMGNLSSSSLFYATNYESVYAIAAFFVGLGFLYTLFCIPESVENIHTEGKLKSLIQTENLKSMVNVAIKRRENNNRSKILIMTMISMICVFAMYGESSLTFLFLREKLDWTLTMFNYYNSISAVIWIVGSVLGIYILHKVLKVRESLLVLIGLTSATSGTVTMGLANSSYHIYGASLLRCVGGLTSPMIRSLISKLVVQEEIAKIFSLMMICEFIFGLGASPLYTAIYDSTLNSDPGIFYFCSAGLYIFNIVLILNILFMECSTPHIYTVMENDEETEVEGTTAIN